MEKTVSTAQERARERRATALRQRRTALGVSRKTLAALADVSEYSVYWLENAGRELRDETEVVTKVETALKRVGSEGIPLEHQSLTVRECADRLFRMTNLVLAARNARKAADRDVMLDRALHIAAYGAGDNDES